MPIPQEIAAAATLTVLGLAFTLICKPEQSGKTFVMIQQIIKDITEPEDDKNVINFIFCDNNLLLTEQTSKRMGKDLKEYTINGESYVEFSSHKRTECNNWESVFTAIVGPKNVRNIICCTNGKRAVDIKTIITNINQSPYTANKFVFKVWLDEADKFTHFINDVFFPLTKTQGNVEVFCLTATPDPLFNKYKGMKVFPLENTTCSSYHGWNDNDIKILENPGGSTTSFIQDVLEEQSKKGKILPNTKWFIPADVFKRTHNMIKAICQSKGFAVFVVNGDGITLARPGVTEDVGPIDKNKELNTQILEMCTEYNLSQYPIAITGNICIGRGISIMSPEFIFDYGILSNCNKKTEASQNAGRLKGNIKDWANYKPPTVFTTAKFDKVAKDFEEKSRKLAILAHEKQQNGEETVVTRGEFKHMQTNKEWDLITDEFDTLKEANQFLKTNKCPTKRSKPNPEGFYESSTTGKKCVLDYYKVKDEMRGWSNTSNLDVKDKRNGEKKTLASRMYVAYKDLEDNTSAVFIVRIVKRK